MNKVDYLLDASALLAYFHKEPGWVAVEKLLVNDNIAISSVNYCEVLGIASVAGKNPEIIRKQIQDAGIRIIPLEEDTAYQAALLRSKTTRFGLSLGDRVCLALSKELGAQAVTADGIWKKALPSYSVIFIR